MWTNYRGVSVQWGRDTSSRQSLKADYVQTVVENLLKIHRKSVGSY